MVNVEEEILHRVDEDPSTSTRQIAREVGVNHWTVWRTLKESLLYPYHVQRVQSLSANDFHPRRRFCEWLVRRSDQNPLFHSEILMTHECCFTRNGILNFHNTHHWAEVNPHIIHQSHFQHRFSINVWASITGSRLVGPFVLPARLTGENYLNFLRVHLPGLLEEIPLAIRKNMWFMHDGAPAHFTLIVRNFLNTTYGSKQLRLLLVGLHEIHGVSNISK
ncbi:DDE 3 and/or HTH Tnp Tc3 2 domain containing protein [Asbolus verrucosus]|uniref:DDE 3 and/or HTH Tnp Tc3 2 domain containing protein n=1 Tax=Asbolus verrucosus TaxID=1661398 RepID=A0A482VCJ7_ASBVE|nr:DDE 3 and/or HTH Tnp Tc3 2 domain containing protein [Asbolus verrucosus]